VSEIENCMRVGSGITINFKDENKDSIVCSVVGGGISWPSINSPGYYCIFGRKSCVNANLKKPLHFLAEREGALTRDLCEGLQRDIREFFCFRLYVNVDEGSYGHYNEFIRLMEPLMDRVELLSADISDWNLGILQIQRYTRDDALQQIPKDSILYNQLGRITKSDDQERERAKFYAVSALINVIGSFDVQPFLGRSVKPASYVY
jgi:hypothetical protein